MDREGESAFASSAEPSVASSTGGFDNSNTNDSATNGSSASQKQAHQKTYMEFLQSLPNWLSDHGVEKIIIPFVATVVRFALFFLFSIILYASFYSYMVPTALAREPVYFDFSLSPPLAKVNLLSNEKQWQYLERPSATSDEIDERIGISRQSSRKKQFLRSGFAYCIDVTFSLAKSQKNTDLGKFMTHLTVVDATGESIATSARPVAMPYQSLPTVLLDSIFKFPLRFFGLTDPHETVQVHVPLMNNYLEPTINDGSGGSSTEVLEFRLEAGGEKADIGPVSVTIMPILKGLTYYMWYYPALSALVGVGALTLTMTIWYLLYATMNLLMSYMSGESLFEGGKEGSNMSHEEDGGVYDDQSQSAGTSRNSHRTSYSSAGSRDSRNDSFDSEQDVYSTENHTRTGPSPAQSVGSVEGESDGPSSAADLGVADLLREYEASGAGIRVSYNKHSDSESDEDNRERGEMIQQKQNRGDESGPLRRRYVPKTTREEN